jgi:putative heme-binding domain-containing protein
VAAIRAAGSLSTPGDHAWAQAILVSDAPNDVRVEALRAMAATPAGLNAILDLAEQARLPAEFRSLATALTNASGTGRGGARGRGAFAPPQPAPAVGQAPGGLGGRGAIDPALVAVRDRAAKVLPLPPAAGTPIPGIQALERNYRGNAAAGRRVFDIDAGCAACHSLGGARKVGPDLAAIGAKYGKQAMLDHILRPNDAIGLEYVMTTFELRSGETVSGIVSESTPERIAVRAADSSERRLVPAEVVSRRPSGISLMPEGLLNALSLQQVSDLLEFLATQTGPAAR